MAGTTQDCQSAWAAWSLEPEGLGAMNTHWATRKGDDDGNLVAAR